MGKILQVDLDFDRLKQFHEWIGKRLNGGICLPAKPRLKAAGRPGVGGFICRQGCDTWRKVDLKITVFALPVLIGRQELRFVFDFNNFEPRTQNPEPRTPNPEPGTRNPEPGTQNPTLNLQSERPCNHNPRIMPYSVKVVGQGEF